MRFDDRVTGNVRTYAPVRADHPRGHRPGRDRQERRGRGADRRRREARPGGPDPRWCRRRPPPTAQAYLDELAEWKRESLGSSWHGSGAWRDGLLSADFVVERIGELTGPRRQLRRRRRPEPDVARPLHGVPAAQQPPVSSGGLGTMGFCVPAAMGAALGRPEFETWAVTGDGGFQMTSQELMTLAADRIPVKIAILDNKKLGMIRQWQEIIYAGNYHSAHLPGPDFVKLAEAYGIPAFRATTHRRGRPDDQGRAGGRRAGAHLVRDRRGAERVPDDAGGQGPVRPDRDVGGARGMSDRPERQRHASPQPAHASAPPPARRLPGHRRRRSATSSSCWS